MPVLTPETEARLAQAAEAAGKTPDAIVRELLGEAHSSSALSFDDSELLLRIQSAILLSARRNRAALESIQKMRPWSDEERHRYLDLTNEVETGEARRIELLSALARRRGVSLPEIVAELGLSPA